MTTFNTIPSGMRKPGQYFEFDNSMAQRGLPTNAQLVLLMGQALASANPPSGLNVPEQIFDAATAKAHYGYGSMLARMVDAALKAYPYATLWAVPVADAVAGMAAASSIPAAGATTPSAAGTVTFSVAGKVYAVVVTANETAASILQALNTALVSDPDAPVSSAYDAGTSTLTITCKHKGLLGNDISLSYDPAGTGFLVTIPAMANGSGSPDLTAALANIFTARYHKIVCPWNDSTTLTALRTHLTDAGNAIEQRGQVGVSAHRSTIATMTALSTALNAERITIFGLTGTPSWTPEVAAAYAAVLASETDPARPLNTLGLTGILPPAPASRYTRTEQETLLANGITPGEVGPGDIVQIVRAITTYLTNPQSIADTSWLDLTTITTMDYTRDALRARFSQRFARAKFTDQALVRVRSEGLDVLRQLETAGILMNVEAQKALVVATRDAANPQQCDFEAPADVVPGLDIIAGKLDLVIG